ncbi:MULTISPECIES: hypothetical protein [Aerosakkonema]|uniref:hypothetical protein n=1 Tax=Aerosakkonema TaxID=1246629 RepID=UPI0035B8E8F7
MSLERLEQALKNWQAKLAEFEYELSITSSAEQKFELRQKIKECEAEIQRLQAKINSILLGASSPQTKLDMEQAPVTTEVELKSSKSIDFPLTNQIVSNSTETKTPPLSIPNEVLPLDPAAKIVSYSSVATSAPVKIHEFSTGIHFQGTPNSWVSYGFRVTEQWMNCTIANIPDTIKRSIANRELEASDNYVSDDPAIIGRVVPGLGSGEPDWSVIAVVTRGRDDIGRSFSLYRYFFCEGSDSLWKILSWIEYQRQNHQMPVFNPFDVKNVNQPNEWIISAKPPISLPSKLLSLLKAPAPILIPVGQPCTALIINELVTRKAANKPVSWAFNVEALKEPSLFQVIYPASSSAYDRFENAIARKVIVTAPILADVADKQAIKLLIRSFINNSTVNSEYLQELARALGNSQIPESYWRDIFDEQGANNAIKQGIYSPQMVRLLILRAIAVPQTLPEYLIWLEKGNKQNDCHLVAAQFESQFRTLLDQIPSIKPNVELKISEGFQAVLSLLLEQKIYPEAVNKLIESPNGLWAKFLRQFIKDIDHDLSLMRQFALGQPSPPFKLIDPSWQSIWKDLRVYWRQLSYPYQEKYQPLAELFENLDVPKIAALFYHVGYRRVPKKIFYQLGIKSLDTQIYGIMVRRKVSFLEVLLRTITALAMTLVRHANSKIF